MERIRNLDRYPKILLLALLVMAVVFAAVYGIISSRVGFLYCDRIHVLRQEDGVTLYEGTIDGADSVFTVGTDTVTFRLGQKTYGPYTVREDPTAVPADDPLAQSMTGVEILNGKLSFFRGGVMENGSGLMLFDADGSLSFTAHAVMSDGTVVDGNGRVVDVYAPEAGTILRLLHGPELEHKGQWPIYLMALFFSAITAVSILFADELMRFRLSFRVRDAYSLEPSDWEIASRTLGWTILTGVILWAYCMGLR